MALSNMKVEPRREITESLLGIVGLVGLVVGDYYFAVYFAGKIMNKSPGDVAMMMIVVPLGIVVLSLVGVGLAYFTHWIGEGISAGLKTMGMDPRPKVRYEMKSVWNAETKEFTKIRREVK